MSYLGHAHLVRFPRIATPRDAATITAGLRDVVINPATLPYGSPYTDSTLARMVFDDVVGKGVTPSLSRAQAMKIPAIARARNRMVSTVCRFPLRAFDPSDALDGPPSVVQPVWMHSTAGATHPQMRTAWTVDDLIFYGWSLWSRNPLTLEPGDRIDRARWHMNADNQIVVDDVPQRNEQVILIPGLHEGILEYGSEALRDTRDLYSMVRSRIRNPVPLLNLHDISDGQLSEEEIDSLIARWAKARQGENGGVSYTNKSIELDELGGGGDAQLMIEARNAAALDMARIVGVSGSQIDATVAKASLNYETTTGRNQEFVDTDVALYTTPINLRLSMDDVLPSGQRAVLDMTDFIAPAPSPTGPGVQD